MIYRVIGLTSENAPGGLHIVFTELGETGGKWSFNIRNTGRISYAEALAKNLRNAQEMAAKEFMRLHAEFGHFVGRQVAGFIEAHNLQHQVQLICSQGHPVFHEPQYQATAQLGDGAAIAAETGINTVSDLRNMDIALGGGGGSILSLGEKLLFPEHSLFLDIGSDVRLSATGSPRFTTFDVCPANVVLNRVAEEKGPAFDTVSAGKGFVRDEVLFKMNQQAYYRQPYPKSLPADFGAGIIYPLLKNANLSAADAMRTMVEHIVIQVTRSTGKLLQSFPEQKPSKILVTGGGVLNTFLLDRLQAGLGVMGITLEVPHDDLVNYKEGLIVALLGVLRWREENTVLHSVTGASRSSIGGAVWIGQET